MLKRSGSSAWTIQFFYNQNQRGREMLKKTLMMTTVLSAIAISGTTGANACTATGFVRDGINLTAALINPPPIKGGQLVEAGSCNMAIYWGPGSRAEVQPGARVHGGNYFAVVTNGAKSVLINEAWISYAGENPFNGDQHGVLVYNAPDAGLPTTFVVRGNILFNYQKAAIVDNNPKSTATIEDNGVLGLGPVNWIAQNGIQTLDKQATIHGNHALGHQYTGPGNTVATDILVLGGPCFGTPYQIGSSVTGNALGAADVGVYVGNYDANCNPADVPTKILISENTADNGEVTNQTGDGPGQPYQAGIVDVGNGDKIELNRIWGLGYAYNANPPPYTFPIDVTFTLNPTVKGNEFDGEPLNNEGIPASRAAASLGFGAHKVALVRAISPMK